MYDDGLSVGLNMLILAEGKKINEPTTKTSLLLAFFFAWIKLQPFLHRSS